VQGLRKNSDDRLVRIWLAICVSTNVELLVAAKISIPWGIRARIAKTHGHSGTVTPTRISRVKTSEAGGARGSQEPLRNSLSMFYHFVTAPYAVTGISPVKLFFDNGSPKELTDRFSFS
jgi:hypothetical protein